MPSAQLLEAVAVTAELCGRVFSESAARVFVADIATYPEAAVMGALRRCRREVRGALTVQDVVSRLEDGRPGPEEAWALMPMTEDQSVVWTDEMAQSFAVVRPLIEAGELVPARMAFKEAYAQRVAAARDAGKPVEWVASLGHDQRSREGALMAAVTAGRLTLDDARELAPSLPPPSVAVMQLLEAK